MRKRRHAKAWQKKLQELSISETKREGEGTSSGRSDTAAAAKESSPEQEAERSIEAIARGMRTISIGENWEKATKVNNDARTKEQEEKRKRVTKEAERSRAEGTDRNRRQELEKKQGCGGTGAAEDRD